MTNDELQMTKEIRSSNAEGRSGIRSVVSSFGFPYSFGFRHSSFGLGNCYSGRVSIRFGALLSLFLGAFGGRLLASDKEPPIAAWLNAQTNIQTWSATVNQTRALKALTEPLTTTGRVWFAA